jgi:hypothetical protein
LALGWALRGLHPVCCSTWYMEARRRCALKASGKDLEPPLQPRLAIFELRILRGGHVCQAALAVEDGAGHPGVKPVLEHALCKWGPEPSIDETLRLPIAFHGTDRVPRFARCCAAVEIEERRAVFRRFRWRLLLHATHATLRHLRSALAPHDKRAGSLMFDRRQVGSMRNRKQDVEGNCATCAARQHGYRQCPSHRSLVTSEQLG